MAAVSETKSLESINYRSKIKFFLLGPMVFLVFYSSFSKFFSSRRYFKGSDSNPPESKRMQS
jgi:hypothetical protein